MAYNLEQNEKDVLAEIHRMVKDAYSEGYDHGYSEGRASAQLERDEIRVGDEIICAGTNVKKVVLRVTKDADDGTTYYMCFSSERGISTENSVTSPPTKTRKHYYEVDWLLKAMNGETTDEDAEGL